MVDLELVLIDADLAVGDTLAFEVHIRNHGDGTVTVAGPLDGSFEGMRDPRWGLEFLDADGNVVPAALGHADLGRCGLTNRLERGDLHHLDPGEALVLRGDDLAWLPPQVVLPSSRPGRWQLRVRYDVSGSGLLTPLSLTSPPVPITLRGGDERLWSCRNEQLARAMLPSTNAGIAWLGAAPDGWTAVATSHTEGPDVSRGAIAIRRFDAALAPAGDPVPLWTGADPGFVAAVDVPDGVLVVHTPGTHNGSHRVELVAWDPRRGVVSRRTLYDRDSGYLVAIARSGDRVAVASGRYDHLRIDMVGVDGAPLGPPTQIPGSYAGFPTLTPTPAGFLLVHEVGFGAGRAQLLGRDGRPAGDPIPFDFAGQTVAAARVDGAAIDLVYADGGYHPDDPSDGLGLFRQRIGGVPEALSPTDTHDTRFGDGAWLDDGRFLRAFVEGERVYAGAGAGPTQVLGAEGSEPSVAAADDRFVVRWADARDDTTPACRELRSCAYEGYAAVLGGDGALLVGPTRLTWDATPRPLAPDQDWERFCK